VILEPVFEDLYREVILDHYRHPRNRGRVEEPDAEVRGVNPLCGDAIVLSLRMLDGQIDEIRVEGKGCSLCQAAASMLTCAVKGKRPTDAWEITALFKRMMLEDGAADGFPDEMDDLRSLAGVKRYPVRIKCVLLPWNVLLQALTEVEERGS
jgi:nitrogen fixation NifU-like protein